LCRASAPQKATHAPALVASGQKRSALAAVWDVSFCWALLGEICLPTQSPPRTPHCQTNLPHPLTRQTFVQGICSAKSNPCTCLICLGTKKKRSRCSVGRCLSPGRFSRRFACQRRVRPEHRIAKRTSHINSPGKLWCKASAPQGATHAPASVASCQKRSALAAVWDVFFLLGASRGDFLVNAEPSQENALPNEPPTSTHQANFGASICSARGNPRICLSCLG
jgi:hypothetical protein